MICMSLCPNDNPTIVIKIFAESCTIVVELVIPPSGSFNKRSMDCIYFMILLIVLYEKKYLQREF